MNETQGGTEPEFDRPVFPSYELTINRGRFMRLNAAAYHWLREANGLGPQDALHIAVRGASTDPDLIAVVVDPGGLKVDPANYACSGVDMARLLQAGTQTVRLPLKKRADGVLVGRISATVRDQAGGTATAAPSGSPREAGLAETLNAAPGANETPAHSDEPVCHHFMGCGCAASPGDPASSLHDLLEKRP